MSLLIQMSVNGQSVDTIEVINRGPIDGEYAEGDGPGGDGVRWYVWHSHGGDGKVLHRRGDGAHALAAKVLADIDYTTRIPVRQATEKESTT